MMIIRNHGLRPYEEIWQNMKDFTNARTSDTPDELWILEHLPVYTQGQAGKPEHILSTGTIPVVQSDRGGQVTYHGPGQMVAYVLIDLKRRNIGIRTLVCQLEQILISTLGHYNISGKVRYGAPGVYVDERKIASIGLRVRNFRTYHGLALNVAMDKTPFDNINPCGFPMLKMADMHDFIPDITMEEVVPQFINDFLQIFDAQICNSLCQS